MSCAAFKQYVSALFDALPGLLLQSVWQRIAAWRRMMRFNNVILSGTLPIFRKSFILLSLVETMDLVSVNVGSMFQMLTFTVEYMFFE
jgi:hypothetical protein